MTLLLQNLRYAFRVLRRQPAFSGVAILTLALGIGATTAVFSVVYGVLLRPLPYRDSGGLVMLQYGHQGEVSPWFSPPNFRDYALHNDAFSATSALAPITVNMTGNGEPERLQGAKVSWNYFDVLGVGMTLGRPFTQSDSQSDGSRIVVSHSLWRRRFGGRQDVINSTTTLDGHAVTIVGVASADLKFPPTADFWQPLIFTPGDLSPDSRGRQWLQVLARLKTGVSAQQATIALQTVGRALAQDFPETEKDVTLLAIPLHERIVGDIRPTLFALSGAVALVLLIACVNVASLLLARAHDRDREVAVRLALGATRRQLVVQLLTESLTMGILAAAAGVGIAALLVRALVVLGPASIPRLAAVTIDAHVLFFALGAAIATSIAFGLMPAVSLSGRLAHGSLGLGSRGAVGKSTTRARRLLVVSELALAATLLVSSGLLIRSYAKLQHVEPGFDPDRVAAFGLSLPEAKYPASANLDAFVSALLPRIEGERGVESAAVAFGLPFTSGFDVITGFHRDDQPEPDSASMPSASLRIVSTNYFHTMRIPIRSGRGFDTRDTAAAPEVALINQRAAERFFPGIDPIGREIRISAQIARGARDGAKMIVGVVGDVKYGALDEESPPEIYLPYDQHPVNAFTVAARTTARDPLTIVPSLRRDVAGLDSLLPLDGISSLASLVDASIEGRRFTMILIVMFAVFAAALSAMGIYGVLAYLVSQRAKEVGVRLAIGASPSAVVWLFVREGLVLTAVGLTVGLAGALAAGHWIQAFLFDVTPADPATLAGAGCALAVAAVLATYVPARRAAGVDPTDALKSD
ncbi:MAG TPA: ABC transporter permease [Vicinamibacterales bacterium]|nr:ABC transporter permease [Vicinamibacterales bacterium]